MKYLVSLTFSLLVGLICYSQAYAIWNYNGTDVTYVVVVQNLPDLTMGNVSPTTASAGVPVTFSATVTNIGSLATGSDFANFFQIASDPLGSNIVQTLSYTTAGPLAAGANAIVNAPMAYTFSNSGTYYVRACADKKSEGDTGIINESNEGNNCSPSWAGVTVQAGPLGPGVELTATPSTINPGNSSKLEVYATNFPSSSISCRIDQGVGNVPMSYGGGEWDSTNPDPVVSPSSNTTYTATCFSPSSGSASTYCMSGSFTHCAWDDQLVQVNVPPTEMCGDGFDNDSDGLIDEGCPPGGGLPQCSDGVDNDSDTFIDSADPGCWTDPNNPSTYDPTDNNESNRKKPIFIEF